jgi:glutamate synthase (NADPH/NADH) large chain
LIDHNSAYRKDAKSEPVLKTVGTYHYRFDGEKHGWNPETIGLLQWSTRTNSYDKYKEFSDLVFRENRKPFLIRGCVNLKKGKPIPIDQVESVEELQEDL